MAEVSKEIIAAKEKAEADLLKRPGVTGVDIGYKEVGGQPTNIIAIRVLVEKKKPVTGKDRIPGEIDGHPTDVIERKFELHQFRARKPVSELVPEVDSGTYTPLKGGISIGPCRAVGGFVYAGTLGAIVTDNVSGKHMLLSNFHVICIDNNFHVGDTQTQPSRVDGGACPTGVVGNLARESLGGSVDCAVAEITGSRGVSCEIVEIGTVAGTNTASLGQAVRKRGRTTGLTYGTVDSIALSVNIDYGPGIGVKTLTNQIGVKPDLTHNPKFGDHGDSGSVVVNSAREVVGLHFAGDNTGYGIANPIAAVLSALNVRICTGVVKKIETKELKDIKEIHKEKLEVKEHKDKVEIKEHKAEAKELKDAHKEKIEVKEISKPEHPEKPIGKEKDGKEIKEGGFEGPGPGGPGDPGPSAGGGKLSDLPKLPKIEKVEKTEIKDFAKTEKPEIKEHTKIEKPENKNEAKEHKNEAKDHKDAKHEKLEKNENKDHKDAKHEKNEKPEKLEKNENKDHKDLKNEKLEKNENKDHKDAKHEKTEKNEAKDHKDLKHEKLEKPEKLEQKEIGKAEPRRETHWQGEGRQRNQGRRV
jgi:hypothetical protein